VYVCVRWRAPVKERQRFGSCAPRASVYLLPSLRIQRARQHSFIIPVVLFILLSLFSLSTRPLDGSRRDGQLKATPLYLPGWGFYLSTLKRLPLPDIQIYIYKTAIMSARAAGKSRRCRRSLWPFRIKSTAGGWESKGKRAKGKHTQCWVQTSNLQICTTDSTCKSLLFRLYF
jgi:hypothetical protein